MRTAGWKRLIIWWALSGVYLLTLLYLYSRPEVAMAMRMPRWQAVSIEHEHRVEGCSQPQTTISEREIKQLLAKTKGGISR